MAIKLIAQVFLNIYILRDIDLIRNNARVGGEIAVVLARLRQTRGRHSGGASCTGGHRGRSHRSRGWKGEVMSSNQQQPVVIGGSILDLTAKVQSREITVGVVSHKEVYFDLWCAHRVKALIPEA